MLGKCFTKSGGTSKEPGSLQLVVLCSAFFANEITVTYELIYMVTIESLLSLPTQFVSIPGVMASATTFLVVPLIGRYTDRGRRHRRRLAMAILSGALQFAGALLLMVACIQFIDLEAEAERSPGVAYHSGNCSQSCDFVETNKSIGCGKLWRCVKNASGNINLTSAFPQAVFEHAVLSPPANVSSLRLSRNVSVDTIHESRAASSPLTAGIALISFSVMAVGFDIGTFSIRSFVLDSVPVAVHAKVLSIGVLTSSLGGCVFSLLGLLDIGAIVGWSKDPTLVRSIFLSAFLMLSVLVSVPVTLFYGNHLKRKFGGNGAEAQSRGGEAQVDGGVPVLTTKGIESAESKWNGKGQFSEGGDVYKSGVSGTKGTPHISCVSIDVDGMQNESREHFHSQVLKIFVEESLTTRRKGDLQLDPEDNSQEKANSNDLDKRVIQPVQVNCPDEHDLNINGGGQQMHSSNGAQHSSSKIISNRSSCFSVSHRFLCRALQSVAAWVKTVKQSLATFHCKLLFLICLVTFFSSGTSIAFEVYFSMFLSVDVFGGDPDAPLHSDLKQRFDTGTRAASQGTLIFMITFFLYNFVHMSVARRVGLTGEYLAVSVVAMPILLTMALTRKLQVFYVVAFLNGIYRSVLFTTPFVMATQLIDTRREALTEKRHLMTLDPGKKEISIQISTDSHIPEKGAASKEHTSRRLSEHAPASYGSTISLVGAMIPLSDLVVSCLMGPLLAVTSEPAVPMILGFISGMAAAFALIGIAVYTSGK